MLCKSEEFKSVFDVVSFYVADAVEVDVVAVIVKNIFKAISCGSFLFGQNKESRRELELGREKLLTSQH